MNEKRFQKNLELWMRSYPKEAVLLPYADTQGITDCKTVSGEENLLLGQIPLHSPQGAAAEASQWFENLELDGVLRLIVFGVGLGYYYEAAKKWLKRDKRRGLFFLEDRLSVIHKLLQTETGTIILQDPQVHLMYFPNFDDDKIFQTVYWNSAMLKIRVSALESYRTHRGDDYTNFAHKIGYDAAIGNGLVDEYIRYGVGFHRNFYHNVLCLEGAYLGNDLFTRFHKVPAIICGAGPSLEKSLPLLSKLMDHALIFAGGSALNVLNSAGIYPHFGAGLDPNPMQLKRLSESNTEELPFFYRNRIHYSAFKEIKGPRLYITGAGGFNTPEYFEKHLDIEREFIDEGHNVINFIVELASAMECDPIIFVGMDLAFTDMKGYAKGVIDDATVEKGVIVDAASDDDRAVLKKDIFGKPTYTLWKWLAESKWISDFAKNHADVRMVNCTEGGIGFEGIANKPLKEVSQEFLNRQYELRDRIHGELQNVAMPHVTTEKIIQLMKDLEQSLRRVNEHIKVLIDDVEIEMKKIDAGQKEGQSGLAALAETELVEEPGFDYVLDSFNDAIGMLMSRDAHTINLRRYSKAVKAKKKLELKREKLVFMRNVALANAELILHALSEKEKENKVQLKAAKTVVNTDNLLNVDEEFNAVKVPKEALSGSDLGNGFIVKKGYAKSLDLDECYIEKGGKMEGEWLLYYPDRQIKQRAYYKAGKLHGPATFYGMKGNVLAQSHYEDGKKKGITAWYYEDGSIYSIQNYLDGQWNGEQLYFNPQGEIRQQLVYKKGVLQKERLRIKDETERPPGLT